MVNQWGRDGNFSSSGARSSGAAGIVVAALVALLLGAGGGYTAARLFGGVSLSDVQSRDEKIADLEKQVSDLKFRNADDSDQTGALRARVEELAKANETLKALADDRTNEAGADARSEIAALKKTIEEAGDLRATVTAGLHLYCECAHLLAGSLPSPAAEMVTSTVQRIQAELGAG